MTQNPLRGWQVDRATIRHVGHDLHVQPLLAAVVVIEHCLVDAGLVGVACDAGGVIAALGDLVSGGLEDRRPGIAARTPSLINQLVS